MSPGNDNRRPAGGGDLSSNSSTSNGTTTIPVHGDRHGHAGQVRGTLVVVVELPGEKYRRRAYLTLASAERAVRRAQEAGYTASVVLARLEPVAVLG